MVGTRVFCPACRREMAIPPEGEAVDERQYLRGERYALVCSCGCRVLVKAEAADHMIHCPECAGAIRVPALGKLRGGRTPALVSRAPSKPPKPSRQYIDTEDLILLVDDKEGPGTEVG